MEWFLELIFSGKMGELGLDPTVKDTTHSYSWKLPYFLGVRQWSQARLGWCDLAEGVERAGSDSFPFVSFIGV